MKKILIDEEVVKQALDALDELREEVRAMKYQDHAPYHYTSEALRSALDAAERVEPAWFIDETGAPRRYTKHDFDQCEYGGLQRLYPAPTVPNEPTTQKIRIVATEPWEYEASVANGQTAIRRVR